MSYPPIDYLAHTKYGSPATIDRSQTVARADALMEEHMKGYGVTRETAELAVAQGIPELEIVKQAKEQDADMIVVATHSRVGLPHVLLGSVADRVLRTAECPVFDDPGRRPQAADGGLKGLERVLELRGGSRAWRLQDPLRQGRSALPGFEHREPEGCLSSPAAG